MHPTGTSLMFPHDKISPSATFGARNDFCFLPLIPMTCTLHTMHTTHTREFVQLDRISKDLKQNIAKDTKRNVRHLL